jgi:hypothetical protein
LGFDFLAGAGCFLGAAFFSAVFFAGAFGAMLLTTASDAACATGAGAAGSSILNGHFAESAGAATGFEPNNFFNRFNIGLILLVCYLLFYISLNIKLKIL